MKHTFATHENPSRKVGKLVHENATLEAEVRRYEESVSSVLSELTELLQANPEDAPILSEAKSRGRLAIATHARLRFSMKTAAEMQLFDAEITALLCGYELSGGMKSADEESRGLKLELERLKEDLEIYTDLRDKFQAAMTALNEQDTSKG